MSESAHRAARSRVAVVGGGWAGLAAAVHAVQDGHHVTVFEASRHWGGRARTLRITLAADGPPGYRAGDTLTLDNGQHILIGAYTDTLRCMRMVGVDTDAAMARTPLRLTYPDGTGLALPDWPAPFDVLAGLLGARGWTWHDKQSLLRAALRWRLAGFCCEPSATVADLCGHLTQRLQGEFIEPLCVSALNTPAQRASGQVFLRVLRDALFTTPKGSNLLLPKLPLGELWPDAAVRWLTQRQDSATLRLACRVTQLAPHPSNGTWQVNGQDFDHVVWANYDKNMPSALAVHDLLATDKDKSTVVEPMQFESIATVYAWAKPGGTPPWPPVPRPRRAAAPSGGRTLPHPMLALRHPPQHPAQFVFDRGQLGGPHGLLAFVVSASQGDASWLEQAVQSQASAQLGLELQCIRTIVEKRATFACTPEAPRPSMHGAPGLTLAGDHVQGPYPATLEGAIRSGWAAGTIR